MAWTDLTQLWGWRGAARTRRCRGRCESGCACSCATQTRRWSAPSSSSSRALRAPSTPGERGRPRRRNEAEQRRTPQNEETPRERAETRELRMTDVYVCPSVRPCALSALPHQRGQAPRFHFIKSRRLQPARP
eukprot:532910-Rhodomonas_salina.1